MKRVAVIGGGLSGLITASECLKAGIEPTIFEVRGDLGGLFNRADVEHCDPQQARAHRPRPRDRFS